MVTKNPSNNDRVFKCILYSETDSGFFEQYIIVFIQSVDTKRNGLFQMDNKGSCCFHYQSKKETS